VPGSHRKAKTGGSLGEEQRGRSCWGLSQHAPPGGTREQGFLQTTGRSVLLTSPDPYGGFQPSRHLLEEQHSIEQAFQELLALC